MERLSDLVALLVVAIAVFKVGRAVRQWWRSLDAKSAASGGCSACPTGRCARTQLEGPDEADRNLRRHAGSARNSV